MSKNIISLKSIITAITRSFSQAQEELCWSQLAALLEFFHDDGSPKTLKFNVPSFNENDNKSDEINTLQAPILSLIAPEDALEASTKSSVSFFSLCDLLSSMFKYSIALSPCMFSFFSKST